MKSAKDYIKSNDFEGALERFNNSVKNWKNHWWETLETIFHNCADWAKKYILDSINHLVTKISKSRGRKRKELSIKWNCAIPENQCGAYLIKHYLNGKMQWIKVGKANNVNERLREHFLKDYKNRIDACEVLAFFPCKSANEALTMENVLRERLEKRTELFGNDSFINCEISINDLDFFAKKYKLVQQIFE